MKVRFFLPLLIICCIPAVFASGKSESNRTQEIVIYAYDSFLAEWGPAPELKAQFEAETGYKLTMISCGDAAQVLSRAVLEKKNPKADVLIGIDNQLYSVAKKENVLAEYKPRGADSIIAEKLRFDSTWLLTPYDWSYFSMIWNSSSDVPPPTSLKDLLNPVYAKKIILMDPRTSTPGLGFVAWTLALSSSQADCVEYWKSLKPNILTMAPGWDAGYGLFTAGEAPLVISYTTSAAYHVECDNTDRYKALIFSEGHPVQVEGAGIVKNAPNVEGAKAFIDFLISEKAQNVLPLTQWMYPVNEAVKLPESYNAAPKSGKTLIVDTDSLSQTVETVMEVLAR